MPATLLEAVTTGMSKTLSLPPGGLGAEGNAGRQRLGSGGLGEGQGGIWQVERLADLAKHKKEPRSVRWHAENQTQGWN